MWVSEYKREKQKLNVKIFSIKNIKLSIYKNWIYNTDADWKTLLENNRIVRINMCYFK